MPTKKGRRSSSVSEESTSVTDYNEDSLQSTPSSISTRKKRKLINSKLEVRHCQEIIDKLRIVKADDGHFLTDSFLRLPNKRSASDYYDVVTSPIDLLKIQSRIKNEEYESFLDFEIDIEQLVDNAKMYHTSSAMEYQDAMAIWAVYEQAKQNIAEKMSAGTEGNSVVATTSYNNSRSSSVTDYRSRRSRKRIAISVDDGLSDQISMTTSEDSRNTSEVDSVSDNPIETFFSTLVTQKTDSGKDITPTFTFLPSKHVYPQYYEVIKDPIDLRIMAQKIKSGAYSSVEDLERDFNTMIKNAKTFNEPKSEVYQDAVELQKMIKNKRATDEHGNKVNKKRARRKTVLNTITEKYAQMIYPDDAEDDKYKCVIILENSVDVDRDLNINPTDTKRALQWQLYKTIANANFKDDSNPITPFMKLPSKKLYPDYYLEITEPMSLLMVKAKIKNGSYESVDETLQDINLVFNNAQQFNVENSGIYKDAVRLQNLANAKKAEDDTGLQDDYMDELLPLVPQSLPAILPDIFKYSHDVQIKKTKSSKPITPNASSTRRTRPPISPEETRVKRINSIFQTVYSYQEDNRFLRDIFMSLPSREQYPDYYTVISSPIDMTIIRKKIDDNKYQTHFDVVEDFKLMFSNAKKFNEESSQIVQDTLTLEKLLKKKSKYFGMHSTGVPRGPKKKSGTNQLAVCTSQPAYAPPIMLHTTQHRIRDIFQTIKEYRDISGRLLCEPFIKLPSKQDMPEYYEYIKKPMEIQTIHFRINNDRYQTLEDLMEDLYLMFDNACKFNEPDSQLYRDSLILLRVALEKKALLTQEDILSEVPNVQNKTKDIMLSMYIEFLNQTDEEGRYLIDSLQEIDGELITRRPSAEDPNISSDSIVENTHLNLDVIKHDLEKRRYKRMDRLQEDLFTYLKNIRNVSGINSQAFDDACKLQRNFISIRDSHCERGEVLLTPALNYVERYLNQEIESDNKEKKVTDVRESLEDDHEFIEQFTADGNYRTLDSVTRQDKYFQVGDFVRIQCDVGDIPRVGEITSLLVPNIDDIQAEDNNSDGYLVRVNWYFYPQQTTHKSTKRFMEKEVFKTSVFGTVQLHTIVNKCLVMYIKDYLMQTSKHFREEDIFICESKYETKDHSFKKLKNIIYKDKAVNDSFINRMEILFLTRKFSKFDCDVIKFDLNNFTFPLENTKESVPQETRMQAESCVYYDQFVCDNGFSVKVGDYVYANDDAGRKQIVRIDQLWKNVMENAVYFSGPWFINAVDVEHLPTRIFYHKEVLLSSLEDSIHNLSSIIGKCAILSYSDYCKFRPTEYSDDDIFSCEFKYFTEENVTKKLKKGLKKAELSTKALGDEIYFFKKEINPDRVASPLLFKCSTEPIRQEYMARLLPQSQIIPMTLMDEDSKGTSLTLDDSICSMSVASSGNNGVEKKAKRKKIRKAPSGYVLYSGEIRKKLMKENPEAEFGLISKEVGQMWRNVPQADKDVYERRALELRQTFEKEATISQELEMRQNELLMKQQALFQNAAQQMHVANSPNQTQRNYMQVPQVNQQIVASGSNTFSNNAPIQYFQASNGQVLQLMPQVNPQTNAVAQFGSSGVEQHMQFIQQSNSPSQQLIYQISPQSQVGQQVIGNPGQFPAQFMMPQNKIAAFHPQISTPMQVGQIPNISNVNCNLNQQNQMYPGFPINQPNIPISQNFNVNQNTSVPVTHASQHFLPVPSKSSRVLHSDIYQKYIDKLKKNAATLSDWKQQLEFSKESILAAQGGNKQTYLNRICQDVAPEFLDSRLILDKDGKKPNQDMIVDCLFQLRDHMLHDAMNIRTQILGLDEL